jgi:GT2 family glycosyltransferase
VDGMLFIRENTTLVSVIILNFNGENYLERCLLSVLGTKYPNFEVIFVDNASTDSSLKIVEENFGNDKRLKIFKNTKNLGFSAGNNFGLRQSKGDYIVFLNNDTIADPNWLATLVDVMEKDRTIGLAGSTILSIDGKKLRGAGGLWSDYLLFLYPVGAGRGVDFEFLPIFEVSFATGCSMIVRKELLDEIGLFDPEIPYNYDDTLLSLKTWLAGKRVVSVPGSRVRHIGGATIKKFWNNQSVTFSLLRAKMCLLFDVYFNLIDLLKALLIFYLSISIELVFLVRNKNVPEILGNIRASMWLIKNFEHVWKNRLDHWSNPKISPEMLVTKFIRIRLQFPICVTHSELTNLVYYNQCLKYEKMLFRPIT